MKRPSISLSALLFLLCLAFLCCWGGLKSRAVAADDPVLSADQPSPDLPSAAAPSEEELRLQASLRISEAMPSNGATLFDEDRKSVV